MKDVKVTIFYSEHESDENNIEIYCVVSACTIFPAFCLGMPSYTSGRSLVANNCLQANNNCQKYM